MKATDFNLSKDISFASDKGVTSFKDSRLLLMDANSFGLLRQMLIEQFGKESAKSLLLKFGYQNGYSDFMQMKTNYSFDSEMELLASGPVIHTWEGIVHAAPTKIEYNRETGEFFFTGVWTNSYEAEQHLSFNEHSDEPVCWTLMGYASGWCTAFFGKPLVAIEPVCVGKGDANCGWEIKPPHKWGSEADEYINAYKQFWS